VASSQRLQSARQAGPILAHAGCLVLVKMYWIDPGGNQRVALQIGSLGAVRLRYPHVAYQHVVPVTYTFVFETFPALNYTVVFRRRPHHLTGCNAWCAYGS